eukprot:6714179-Prymnesium_polylepis.2
MIGAPLAGSRSSELSESADSSQLARTRRTVLSRSRSPNRSSISWSATVSTVDSSTAATARAAVRTSYTIDKTPPAMPPTSRLSISHSSASRTDVLTSACTSIVYMQARTSKSASTPKRAEASAFCLRMA